MSTYSSPTDISPLTKALSATINNLDAAVATAFALLPTETNLTRGTVNYAVDTGAVNAYVVALPHTPSGFVDGLQVDFRPLATNTGAATINVNSLGVKSIKNASGSALSAGDITVGIPVMLRYSTATGAFHVAPNSAVSAVAAANSAAAALISQNAAAASASSASTSASTATTQAGIATTQASNASASATTATTQASNASNSASSATVSASTATTQASNASTSASNASSSASSAATSASNASTSASNAATSETNAAASATNLTATSTTSLTPSLAEKVVTTQSGKAFNAGTYVMMVSASDATVTMYGPVTSYTGTTLTFTPTVIGTASAKSDWTISGRVGARGTTGATGAGVPANLTLTNPATAATLTVADNSSFITTGAFSLTLASTATTVATLPAGTVTLAQLGANTFTAAQNEAHGADIASASTVNLTTATGNLVDITGTTAITAITLQEGAERTVRFTGALTLTKGASLVLPGAANITTAAGDFAIFRGYASGVVRCVVYAKASGQPIAAASIGDNAVIVHSGNGYGSTNTKIRRFTTTLTSVGTAITYADSATNGASFTINETGLYSINYKDFNANSAMNAGITVNSSELTINVQSTTIANLLSQSHCEAPVAGGWTIVNSASPYLTAGDIIRAHTDGAATPTTTNQCFFSIRKVGA